MTKTTEAPYLRLAGGEVVGIVDVEVETTYERIYSDRSVIADMKWEQAHGAHVHRFAGKPRKAQVTEARRGTKHVDCDGAECGGVCGGEGYDTSAWFCAHDDSELEPRYVPDVEARTVGIPVWADDTYSLTLRGLRTSGPIEGGTLNLGDGRTVDLPLMYPGNMSFTSFDNEPSVQYSGTAREALA